MSRNAARASRWAVAVLLGLAATVLVLGLHALGLDRRAELQTLDLRFRHLTTAPQNDRIVHIDIDDRSLAELGRWPWPRAQLAGIVELLDQAGARSIALDIIMPEPQKPRYVAAATDLYTADTGQRIGSDSARLIFDDKTLAETLRACGNVFLPMHVSPWVEKANDLADRVERLMRADVLDFRTVLKRVLPNLPDHTRTEQFDVVLRAYIRSRGLAALERFAIPAERISSCPRQTGTITPPLATLAAACYQSGFVTFDPDVDGVVRRIPMLGGDDSHTYPQFALAMAADELASDHGGKYTIAADASTVTIRCPDGFERKIPIDRTGHMLINWLPQPDGEAQPRHVSAAKVGAVWLLKQNLRDNRVRRRLLNFALLSLAREFPTSRAKELYWSITELDKKANELHQRLVAAVSDRQRAIIFEPNNVPPEPIELQGQEQRLDEEIDRLCDQFRREIRGPDRLATYLASPAGATQPTTAAGRSSPDAARFARDREQVRFFTRQIERIDTSNAKISKDLALQLAELRDLVAGKLCLVGSVATGAADFVPTPVRRRTPGVWVHANILNTVFSGAFIRRAGPATEMLAILLAGMAISFLAATRPVLQAGPLSLLIAAAYAAANGFVAFARFSIWLPMVAPLAAMLASLLVVTAYRQLTEERAKRRIRNMFAHALSPALVDRLIEDPSVAKLGGERRELTFLFSDLQGFTPLAERLGEEQTVRLLNRYFDRMTEVIQNRHGGYLNKFLGDGLFVFFGAPVYQKDHAARAILSALDCQKEIEQLNRQLAAELGHDVTLASRIGLATGKVMVGNCGSSQRMDYTAIGDPVNLASRLESASKFFGTRILVSEPAWRQGGSGQLLARPLGKVTVVGKQEPVGVWHLLCEKSEAPDGLEAAYRRFAEAIGLLARREFAEAAKLFGELLADIPDDGPTKIFLDLCRKYQSSPPGDDWDCSIHLAEK